METTVSSRRGNNSQKTTLLPLRLLVPLSLVTVMLLLRGLLLPTPTADFPLFDDGTITTATAMTSAGRIPVSSAVKCDVVSEPEPIKCNAKGTPKIRPTALFQSQGQEDRQLLEWFHGLCNGTYIEMGGLDGIRWSNSHVFNKSPLQWRGVSIEPSPRFEGLQKNRPNKIATMHADVCEERQMVHWVHSSKSDAIHGIWEFAAESYRQRWWKHVQNG